MNVDINEYQQAGYNLYPGKGGRGSGGEYKAKFNKQPYANTKEWQAFNKGWQMKEQETLKKLGYDEFMKKYHNLCKEYGVSISTGCGCCGGGGSMHNIPINVDTP